MQPASTFLIIQLSNSRENDIPRSFPGDFFNAKSLNQCDKIRKRESMKYAGGLYGAYQLLYSSGNLSYEE